jgi:predicted naringenin-chalcone synthase
MDLAIVGIGTAVPTTRVTQKESVDLARMINRHNAADDDFLPALYEQTTIRTRHLAFDRSVVDDILHGTCHTGSVFLPAQRADHRGPTTAQRMEHYAREAAPLAIRAAGRALEQSGKHARDVTHLITVSCTGFGAPGVDCELIRGLGLPTTVERTNIGFMGCHGALNGLRVARGFAAVQPDACVLLCSVELCGVHYNYSWDPKRVVASALFADGAAALVGVPANGSTRRTLRARASGGCLFADSDYAMAWRIADHGFEMTLSPRVPKLIALNLKSWLEPWLVRHGFRLKDVASWAVHPGGPRIVSAVEEALGLEATATTDSSAVLAEFGNMSSPTILFILERLLGRDAPRPWVALGFGPGLAAEAALLV